MSGQLSLRNRTENSNVMIRERCKNLLRLLHSRANQCEPLSRMIYLGESVEKIGHSLSQGKCSDEQDLERTILFGDSRPKHGQVGAVRDDQQFSRVDAPFDESSLD